MNHVLAAVGRELLAERFFVGPVPGSERLVHQRDSGRVEVVLRGECPAGEHRNIHRAEIVLAGDHQRRSRAIGDILGSRAAAVMTRDEEEILRPASLLEEGHAPASAHGGHAIDALHPRQQTVEIVGALPELAISREVHVDLHRQHMVGAEARVDTGELDQAAYHQPGADEQHEGRGDFRDDEHATQVVAVSCGSVGHGNRRSS